MKILIADDKRINRALMGRILAELGECTQVADGLEAVKEIIKGWKEDNPYEIIFLDIVMPVLDGMETLKKIRELESKQNIPKDQQIKIVMTTSKDDKASIVNAAKIGAISAYLVKPIIKEKLFRELKKVGIIN